MWNKWNEMKFLFPLFVLFFAFGFNKNYVVMTEKSEFEYLRVLLELIEKNLNRKPQTPNDFKFVAEAITTKVKETISATTLMRLWGYVKEDRNTRISTLNILARYLNYSDYNSFIEYLIAEESEESARIFSKSIISANLCRGQKIEMTWNPNRRCVVSYLGEAKFEIVLSENSKLKVGDSFSCSHFIINEPLYLFDLNSGGEMIKTYEIGKRSGLTSLKVLE